MNTEPSLIECDYKNPRDIPSEAEAVSTLSEDHLSEERSWLSESIVAAGFFDDLNPNDHAEVLRLIIKHGKHDIRRDLMISLRCFLDEMNDV